MCNCANLFAFRPDYRCSHQFICLICSDSGVHSDCFGNCHMGHPKQQLVSDELLLSKYSSVECSEITIFGCPYCDRQQLSISTLYDHLTLEHLDVPFNVRCPICVCFGETYPMIEDIHLTKHLVDEHSVTKELYEEQILAYTAYHDNKNLLKFYACILPPTYYDGGVTTIEMPTSGGGSSITTSANVPS
ncbi:E3 ubiquitin-protein ligase Kcmf1-like [Ochlerotatus camptorhynchus]|uniref:E3 ubiquitin-protein ligase Kcmf1-like n=1 Tax=Ochlerotatus camptorhynchus TaxID=644619 RepID=UPI0031E2AD50